MLDVVLCCRFKDPARPIEPVPEAFRTLPVLLTGLGMIDISSSFGRVPTVEAGCGACEEATSVDVMLLWKSSKLVGARRLPPNSKDAVLSSCQALAFAFSGAMDAKLKRDILLIES